LKIKAPIRCNVPLSENVLVTNFGVWYAYCKVINFVGKWDLLEAVVHLMCMYAVLYTVDILFSILTISFISTNETVLK